MPDCPWSATALTTRHMRGPDPDNTRIDFPRQALHAEVLTLEHPDQPGTRMTWTAELPKDLRQLEAALRSARL